MGAQASVANDAEPLLALIGKANERRLGGLNYAGEVFPQEAFEVLSKQGGVLVDVRTDAEWKTVGLPDVAATKAALVPVSWKIAPTMALNADFVAQLEQTGIQKDTPLFFLCRSGGRSLDAAVTMTARGYSQCFNVTGGFEGAQDTIGWKAANLPCKQG